MAALSGGYSLITQPLASIFRRSSRLVAGIGLVDRDAQHPDGGAVFPHGSAVPGAVEAVGQAAHHDGTGSGQPPPDVLCGLQAVLGGLAAAHHPHGAGLVEPGRVPGAVEYQRHIRDAGQRQRIIRVFIGQDADIPGRTPPRKGAVMLRRVVGQERPLRCPRPCRAAERIAPPLLPRLLRPAKRIQNAAVVAAAHAQRPGQPEPAEQRVGGRFGREEAGLPPGRVRPAHRLSSRKCHSRMLPAMPAFRLSTRSVIGMRTVPSQAAMVASVRPWPSLPMTTQTPPG